MLLCKTLSKTGIRFSQRWTEQFSGSSIYAAGVLMIATTENTIQAASTTMSASQLSDIIQQVPQVLGHMSRKSRRALMSTSRQFRSQMHQTATSMKVQSEGDLLLLVSQQWSQLKVVHLRGLHDLDARSLTQLAMADWPLLQSLSFRSSKICA